MRGYRSGSVYVRPIPDFLFTTGRMFFGFPKLFSTAVSLRLIKASRFVLDRAALTAHNQPSSGGGSRAYGPGRF